MDLLYKTEDMGLLESEAGEVDNFFRDELGKD